MCMINDVYIVRTHTLGNVASSWTNGRKHVCRISGGGGHALTIMCDEKTQFEQDAVEFASRAVQFDRAGATTPAAFYYREAAQALQSAFLAGSQVAGLTEKANEYLNRAEELLRQSSPSTHELVSSNAQQLQLDRAKFLLLQALDEDEACNSEDALELYTQAVELCLQARSSTEDKALQEKLTSIATNGLERAEVLKCKIHGAAPKSPVLPKSRSPPSRPCPHHRTGRLGTTAEDNYTKASSAAGDNPSEKKLFISGSDGYTKEEIHVLRVTSVINGREYVPFMATDRQDRFAFKLPFNDPDGKLLLSPKQKDSFSHWVRPEDLSSDPKVIELVDCFSIRQTVVSDCSFVASLAVSALYEKRFNKKIITSIIYPQNRQGQPVYNPCGKYTVKLNINGVPRKVVVDDTLPIGKHSELLCSYSNNKNEFWVSLLEKAYMKVMGGYDFPGSNSNIDLHALTGWIPERVSIRPNEADFNKDALFRKLLERHHRGDVLVTLATGELSDSEAERSGLVPTHAYAMLDVKEVLGKRLFLLKNPWSHLRWKGKYSEKDTVSWTPDLAEALRYNPRNASMFDNGVFWIDYDSLLHFFDVAYLNWNPGLFQYTYCTHQSWNAVVGPTKDVYNIGENPQYTLELSKSGCAVWILLTRHITDRDDFANNKEYIALLVYKTNGKKVYLPFDPPPYIDGARINSPHYLCKLVVPPGGDTRYTLVISQYEKSNTIHYTLRAYASCPFQLSRIGNPYQYVREEKRGAWTAETAGGCGNHPQTYGRNPVYQACLQSPDDNNQVLITLKGPKQYQLGFDVIAVTVDDPSSPYAFSRKSSGMYKSGFTVLEMERVPAGIYNIIPSTFQPFQEGPFFLTVSSTCPFKFSRLR
ncbi:calpain-7-like isoform X2 [Ornithodoros turicata]|uniref:calpain-7-like isoform X2 n=1 Tax=Ornithodoros turicata TaxID=34597 RepID=UPI0031386C11